MHDPGYRDTLETSWQLVKSHPLLWLFGLFAAAINPIGIFWVVKQLGLVGLSRTARFPILYLFPDLVAAPVQPLGLTLEGWLLVLWFFLVTVGLFALALFIGTASQGALVHSVGQYESLGGKRPSIRSAWHAGAKHFWRILAIVAGTKIILFYLSLVMAAATFAALVDPTVFDSFLFVGLFVLSLIVGISVSFLSLYAIGYIVIEEEPLLHAIGSAWRLFVEHWLVTLEIAAILFGLNVGVSLVVIFLYKVLLLPSTFLWAIAATIFGKTVGMITFVIGLSLFGGITVLLISLFTAYVITVWTHLFLKMHRRGIGSVVHRVFRR